MSSRKDASTVAGMGDDDNMPTRTWLNDGVNGKPYAYLQMLERRKAVCADRIPDI